MRPRPTIAWLAWGAVIAALLTGSCRGRQPSLDEFLRTKSALVALTHVTVIDGTGSAPRPDQTVLIRDGRIDAVGPAAAVSIPPEAETLNLEGRTVMPGMIGMHDHLFYMMSRRGAWPAQESFATLYLAAGVTTIRTTGTLDFDADLETRRRIEAGSLPGPRIHLTSPYLNAAAGGPDPDRVASEVHTWADRGATWIKAYTSLRRAELEAAIRAAHGRGLKVTGHLCAVGFREAAAMGIENLEHGLLVSTDLSPKVPDTCPEMFVTASAFKDAPIDRGPIRDLMAELVERGVAITSTLAVFASYTPSAAGDPRLPELFAPALRALFHEERAAWTNPSWAATQTWQALVRKEMEFERAFVAAGGLLVAGSDPTGWGGVVAGAGNQRQLELLVEAGFTPVEAIQIATANGARLLGEEDRVGTIEVGKLADLVVMIGDVAANIGFARNVEIVFKDGMGYNPAALIASVAGTIGR